MQCFYISYQTVIYTIAVGLIANSGGEYKISVTYPVTCCALAA